MTKLGVDVNYDQIKPYGQHNILIYQWLISKAEFGTQLGFQDLVIRVTIQWLCQGNLSSLFMDLGLPWASYLRRVGTYTFGRV